MDWSLRDKLAFLAVLILLALIVTDCSSGHKRFCPGVVQQHVYNPPYTSTHTHVDDKGNARIESDYHPAEYHLIVECQQPHHVADVSVGLLYYGTVGDKKDVVIGEQVGRWTTMVYYNWVESTHAPVGNTY